MKEEASCYDFSHTNGYKWDILQHIKDFLDINTLLLLSPDQYFSISSQLKNKNSHQQNINCYKETVDITVKYESF